MSLVEETASSKVRSLMDRHLQPDEYLRELTDLADCVPLTDGREVECLTMPDRIMALRRRIMALRQRIRELESHK